VNASKRRLLHDRTHALPTMQFTPDQRSFRETAGEGRWQSDIAFRGFPGPAHRMTQHADNTCDLVALDVGDIGWLDLGGATPRDFAAGLPC
jgi:hypothetical protein